MKCWWAQPSSHDRSVHEHSRARSVSGTQLMAAGWDFVDLSPEFWSGKFWSGGPKFSVENWSGRTDFFGKNGPPLENWSE